MNKKSTSRFRPTVLIAHLLLGLLLSSSPAFATWSPAGEVQPMLDQEIWDRVDGLHLKWHDPVWRGPVLFGDLPWERGGPTYATVVQTPDDIRLYYRGLDGNACVAISPDGIHFTKPNLGLVEYGGSKENNIVWRGRESHNFAPFYDPNPTEPDNRRFKALGARTPMAMISEDGLRWKLWTDEPVLTGGLFDSLNEPVWDAQRQRYIAFARAREEISEDEQVRAIRTFTSKDFLHWEAEGLIEFEPHDATRYHFYTSTVTAYPGNPNLFLSFPKRFFPDRRKIHEPWAADGVSDTYFMFSHDGQTWKRPLERAWLRPGHDSRNWGDRSVMMAVGIVETLPWEWSLYAGMGYRATTQALHRFTVRRDGFVSLHSNKNNPGTALSQPFTLEGEYLVLNYATSAGGQIRVGLTDRAGNPIPGFAPAEQATLFGDEVQHVVQWENGHSLHQLAGQEVRLAVELVDSDLFSFQFVNSPPSSHWISLPLRDLFLPGERESLSPQLQQDPEAFLQEAVSIASMRGERRFREGAIRIVLLLESNPPAELELEALQSLGSILGGTSYRHARGLQWFRESIPVWQQVAQHPLANPSTVANALYQIGHSMQGANEMNGAYHAFHQAAAHDGTNENTRQLALRRAAECLAVTGQQDQARLELIDLANSATSRNLIHTLLSLGQLEVEMNRLEDAKSRVQQLEQLDVSQSADLRSLEALRDSLENP